MGFGDLPKASATATSVNLTYTCCYGRTPGRAELVEKRGACPLFLPPYSPDFISVELAFSKLKIHLRTA